MNPDTESLASQLRSIFSEAEVVLKSENTERGYRVANDIIRHLLANYPEVKPWELLK